VPATARCTKLFQKLKQVGNEHEIFLRVYANNSGIVTPFIRDPRTGKKLLSALYQIFGMFTLFCEMFHMFTLFCEIFQMFTLFCEIFQMFTLFCEIFHMFTLFVN